METFYHFSKFKSKILLIAFMIFSAGNYAQTTFTVNTTSDTEDINLEDNICKDVNGNCSLRAAIQNSNNTVTKDFIDFNIAGQGPHHIYLEDNLPIITTSVDIDGTSQPEYSLDNLQIVITGENIPLTGHRSVGIFLGRSSSNCVIEGLVIGGFGNQNETTYQAGVGMLIEGSNIIIQNNYIGIAADGETAFPNHYGIEIGNFIDPMGNNLIGGPSPENRNVISGNLRIGLEIGYFGSGSLFQGNYIGTNSSGTKKVPNGLGVLARVTNVYDGNLISGNNSGLSMEGDDNLLINNLIGTDHTGKIAIPNDAGVEVNGDNNLIGQPGAGNIISGNTENGISIYGGSNNILEANHIGTDIEGVSAMPNLRGILLSGGSNNSIGGISAGSGNIISGNLDNGIHIADSNLNKVYGNLIGVQVDGVSALSNAKAGIYIYGDKNQIGGGTSGSSNTIGLNLQGVAVAGVQNKISGNVMFGNNLGIDLGPDNRNDRNDRNDADSGPNNYQNYPVLYNANFQDSYLNLDYKLDSDISYSTYPITMEVFISDGNRQGHEYLGEFILNDFEYPKGNKSISAQVELVAGNTLSSGDKIVITATDALGNTSEFSEEISVAGSSSCIAETYYADNDSDGFGDPSLTKDSCTQPEGFVKNNTDCDDTEGTTNPGAVDDSVDGIDQNCDGIDGPVTSCTGADVISVKEICSTATLVTWEISNPGSCYVDGRWQLRKNSSTGDSSGSFSLNGGETIQFTSGVVSKGKTQIVVYWNDSNGLEVNTSQNASGIECSSSRSSLTQSSESEGFYISPNPISDSGIGIFFPTANTNTVLTAVIYDLNGRNLVTENFIVQAGNGYLLWNLEYESWTDGTYILNVSIEDQIYQTMFIK